MTKMNYWIHRITGGSNAAETARLLLFKENFVSIGWSELSNEENICKIKDHKLESIMEELGWGRPRNRHNLHRFICDMQKGDVLVVPLPKQFAVCEIVDDVIYSNESLISSICKNNIKKGNHWYFENKDKEPMDLGFYRKVKIIINEIPRYEYADSDLTKKLKIRQTNSNITSIKKSVDNAVNAFKNREPINIKEIFIEEAIPKLLSIINQKLTPEKFEGLVEWYLKSIGANVDTPRKNESKTECGDADKVGFFDNIKTAILVQVKKHDGETDDWAVKQIKAFKHNHRYEDYHSQLWVISSCDSFSESAISMAEDADIRLIDGKEFCRMILNNGLENLEL